MTVDAGADATAMVRLAGIAIALSVDHFGGDVRPHQSVLGRECPWRTRGEASSCSKMLTGLRPCRRSGLKDLHWRSSGEWAAIALAGMSRGPLQLPLRTRSAPACAGPRWSRRFRAHWKRPRCACPRAAAPAGRNPASAQSIRSKPAAKRQPPQQHSPHENRPNFVRVAIRSHVAPHTKTRGIQAGLRWNVNASSHSSSPRS